MSKHPQAFPPPVQKPVDVALMKETVGPSVLVKASGGIRDLDAARRMIAAGADRLGASASVAIMQEASESSDDLI